MFVPPQLNRHSTDASRQFADVKAHAEAGLNFMRLWGGSGGASSLLFEAADELGVLIMHEFWMSGGERERKLCSNCGARARMTSSCAHIFMHPFVNRINR